MARMDAYILTEDDLSNWPEEAPPEIRAAANPNPLVLAALLNYTPSTPRRRKYSANAYVPGYTNHCLETPLIAAIKAQLPRNAGLLLGHGADPNGYSLRALSEYASLFLRFRKQRAFVSTAGVTREEALRQIETPQISPVTPAEIEARSTTFSLFWSGPDYIPTCCYKGGDGMSALEEACKHASTEVFDIVLSASPDISFWMRSQTDVPDPATPSSLSLSNPLLCAIKHCRIQHLRRLLELGLNPNGMPLACRQQSYSPLMATLLCCNPPNWDAYSLLLAHPTTDRDLLTPITKVHILHIAVAHLSLTVLERTLSSGFALSTAAPTAAGHTLLHIACLPLDITHVNIFQESIYHSSHEYRLLDTTPPKPTYIIFDADTPRPPPTDFFPAQTQLALYLVSASADPDALIAAQDCHGNTALHYLALHRTVNTELLDALISRSPRAEDVYYEARNRWDWTPENLVRHGEVAEADISKSFWSTRHAATVVEGGRVVPYG